MTTELEQLLETVREGLRDELAQRTIAAHAALDRIAAIFEELERERDILFKGQWAQLNQQLERAEALCERQREALEAIADPENDSSELRRIARTALASEGENPSAPPKNPSYVHDKRGRLVSDEDDPFLPIGHPTC